MATVKTNPFNLGSVLSDEGFCNREKELDELLSHARNSANVILYSSRRRGKTSLMKRVMDEISREGYLAVYVDYLSVIGENDVTEKFFSAVARAVGKDVTEKSFAERVMKLFTRIRPSIDIGPDTVSISARYDRSETFGHLMEDIFLGLNKYLKDNERRCLVVFDEFQEISSLPESKRIEGILREHIQDQNNISFFFVGSRRHVLRSMFTDSKRAFYRLGFIYEMENIPKAEFVPYIVDRFRDTGKKCPEEVAADIYDYVAGNTYYIQKLSHILWNMTGQGGKSTGDMPEKAKVELIRSEAPIFQASFVGMNFGEKKLVRALAVEPSAKPYSIDYLARHTLSAGGVQKSLRSLIDKDVVEIVDGTHRLVDAVFGKWSLRAEMGL